MMSTEHLHQIIKVLSFQGGFNTNLVLLATLLLGMASGSIGTFLVLRKRTMMSDALAHCTLPGLACGFLISLFFGIDQKHIGMLMAGACISGTLGVLSIHMMTTYTRLSEDSAIGIVLSVFFGVGIVLLSYLQGVGNAGGLHHYIFGQTASMTRVDLLLTLMVAAVALLVSTVLFKEFAFLCFDKETASVQGWPTQLLDVLLLLMVTLVTIVGIQAVGMILIIALMSIPPSAARFWSEKLPVVFFLSTLFGALSSYAGAALSAVIPGIPTGAIIVLVAGSIFSVSFIFAPRHGYVAEKFRSFLLQKRIVREHMLRSSFEYLELARKTIETQISFSVLPGFVQLQPLVKYWVKRELCVGGLIVSQGDTFHFTQRGFQEAARLTKNHRLWERYLYHHGTLSLSHVDYSADLVEHVLSEDMIRRLEEDLLDRGEGSEVPGESIHALGEDYQDE